MTARREQMAATYRRGGFGYGEVKKALAEVSAAYFQEAIATAAAIWPLTRSSCGRSCRTEPVGHGARPARYCSGPSRPAV